MSNDETTEASDSSGQGGLVGNATAFIAPEFPLRPNWILSRNRMSRVVRHHQRAMRRGQDPFVENSESIAQVGLKMPLEIEWDHERHREVLCSNYHDHRHGRNPTKVSIYQIHFQ